jgi:ribose/xylose/arabinose/galactoside ABC-type transport system permease subunit
MGNISSVLLAAAPLGCLVLAQSTVLLTGNFDLSIEQNMIFVAIVGGLLMVAPETAAGQLAAGGWGLPWPWPVALAVMLALAALIGLFNGIMIVWFRMNNFMTTLSVMIILEGLALVVGNARNIFGIPAGFRFIGTAKVFHIPVAAFFLILLYVLMHLLLTRTVFGRQLYAVGSNRDAARSAGINDKRVIVSAYVLAGLLAGVAAFVLVGRLGTASAGISDNNLFLAFAAAVIGGVSLFGGRGTAFGALGGLLLITVIHNAMNLAQIPANYIKVVSGGVIMLAVLIDALRTGRSD